MQKPLEILQRAPQNYIASADQQEEKNVRHLLVLYYFVFVPSIAVRSTMRRMDAGITAIVVVAFTVVCGNSDVAAGNTAEVGGAVAAVEVVTGATATVVVADTATATVATSTVGTN